MHMLQSKISIAVPVLLVAAYYFWSFISHTQQSTDPYIKIYVYMNGQWADPVAVDIPRAICGSVRPRCVADIVCDAVGISGECTVYSESGLELKSCVNLASNEKYSAVPPDQRFIYIPHVVGREVPLVDIAPLGKPVVLKTLSQKPKVFELINFFDDNEAEFLINNALALRSETHRLKRSTTGSENILVDSKRTSESAFDISSSVALLLKKRTIKMLRYGLYDETVMDGFQILRYNVSAAYNDHYDYIDSSSDPKYDSYREEGGETMFPNADGPPERVHTIEEGPEEKESDVAGETSVLDTAVRSRPFSELDVEAFLSAYNLTDRFPHKGFERQMLVRCRTKFAPLAVKLRAVLFYSQLPDRRKDMHSLHGGCPVVKGEKWLANLWVWNGPRHEFWEDEEGVVGGDVGVLRPRGKDVLPQVVTARATVPILVTFKSIDAEGVYLFWNDVEWGELLPGTSKSSNSYAGHVWTVRLLDGKVVKTFEVPEERQNGAVVFTVSKSDLYN